MYQNFSPYTCMWLTLCQFNSHFVVEYLPIYRPTQEERRDPKLFASNVRIKMAEHLSVSLANVTLDDRFNKKTDPKKTKSENHTTTKEGGEKEMELLEIIDRGEKKNDDLDEID